MSRLQRETSADALADSVAELAGRPHRREGARRVPVELEIEDMLEARHTPPGIASSDDTAADCQKAGRLRDRSFMTLLIAFIAGAVCATVLILLIRSREPASLPQLAELQQAVQQIRVDQRGDSGQLRGLVSGIVDQQEQLVRQTGQLSEALRRPGVRGQWGETTLRQVVESGRPRRALRLRNPGPPRRRRRAAGGAPRPRRRAPGRRRGAG